MKNFKEYLDEMTDYYANLKMLDTEELAELIKRDKFSKHRDIENDSEISEERKVFSKMLIELLELSIDESIKADPEKFKDHSINLICFEKALRSTQSVFDAAIN